MAIIVTCVQLCSHFKMISSFCLRNCWIKKKWSLVMWHQLYPLDGPKTSQHPSVILHLLLCESIMSNSVLLSRGVHARNASGCISHIYLSLTGVTEKSSMTAVFEKSFSRVVLSLTCNLLEHRGRAATSWCPSRKLLQVFISTGVAAGSEAASSRCEKQCFLLSDETISGAVPWKGWDRGQKEVTWYQDSVNVPDQLSWGCWGFN